MKLRLLTGLSLGLLLSGTALTQTAAPTVALGDAPLPPARSSLPQLGLTADEQLTLSQERALGRVLWRDLRAEPDVLSDSLVSDYLQTLIMRLAQPLGLADEISLRAFAVSDSSLNAFAMPSGLMGVHTGLMLSVATEGELAGVLAHEIGHVSQRHFARGLANQKDNAWIGLAGFAAALVAAKRGNAQSDQVLQSVLVGSQAVQASKQLAFSRDMEREADSVGFSLIKEAQYDGTDMVRMLRRLGAASSLNETGTAYARSHPGASERMANIEGRLKIASTSVNNESQTVNLNFLLLQARLRALLAKTPEGASDATERFEFQISAASAPSALAAGRRLAAHYGLALLAVQKKQPLQAAQHLVRAREFAITHPWLEVLDFEITSLTTTKSALNLAAFINRQGLSGAAASLEAILLVQRNQSILPSDSVAAAQSFLQRWLSSHPYDDIAWGALAATYTQQAQAAMAAWAQAEQTAAMGVWASSISLLTTALRSGEATVPVTTQNQWRTRLQELRQIVIDEKTLLDKFK